MLQIHVIINSHGNGEEGTLFPQDVCKSLLLLRKQVIEELLEGTSKKLRSLWKFDWKCVCMYYLSNKGPTKNIILLLGVPLYKSFLDEALSSWRSHRTKLLTRWVTSSKPQQDRGSPSEHLNSCSSLFCNGCTLLVYKSRMCMRWKILKGAP